MSFDFVIYLDRYLEKNKEESKSLNPKIKALLGRRNIIMNQLNKLELLKNKLN